MIAFAAQAKGGSLKDAVEDYHQGAHGKACVDYIEALFEALLGAYEVANLAAEQWQGHDALIIAAFGDPGLLALREALPIPVAGITESALMSACMLGSRFSIIAISRRIAGWYRETVLTNGLSQRLASIRFLDQNLRDPGLVHSDHGEALRQPCKRAVQEGEADVIILAGAPLAVLARRIADQIPVPLVDGVSSAVRHAESLVSLKPWPATAASFALPPKKANQGLPEAIAGLLAQ